MDIDVLGAYGLSGVEQASTDRGRVEYGEKPQGSCSPANITLSFFFFFFFFCFLGLNPRHMEVSRLGVNYQPTLQPQQLKIQVLWLQPTPQLTAMPDP